MRLATKVSKELSKGINPKGHREKWERADGEGFRTYKTDAPKHIGHLSVEDSQPITTELPEPETGQPEI